MPAIDIDGVTKRYGDVLALNDLDLTIEEGEIFGFLGPNGAGKSTTLNMLLNFIDPSEGAAEVFGLDTRADSTAIRRRTGVLPEGFAPYDRLTGVEHVEYAIETKDATDDPTAVLDRVGLDPEDARRKTGEYSKGMCQRLALGTALVGDPDLLVLDEPSSGLDPTGIQEMRDLIRREADDGTTVFFSSHILSEVEAVCDRVGIMNEGALVALDSIDALRDAAGTAASIELEVETVPDSLALSTLDGVTDVAVDGRTVRATCESGRVKPAVVRHVDEHATVLDVLSEDTSLEELFNSYTGAGGDGVTAAASDDDESHDDDPTDEGAEAPEVRA